MAYRTEIRTDKQQKELEFRAEQVELLYSNSLTGLVSTVVNGLIVGAVLWGVTPHNRLILWNIALIILSIARLVLSRQYRNHKKSLEDYGRWEKRFMVLIGLSGLTWGAMGMYLFPEHSIAHQFFIPFVLSGMVAGSLALYSSKMRVFVVFAVPVSAPVVIKFFTLGGPLYYAMGSLMAIFTVVLLAAARRFRRVMRDSLELRHENRGLVAHLTEERDRAELLNQELHDEIEERRSTAEQLAESEEKHRLVVEKAFDAIVVAQDGIIRFANPRVAELSGYDLKDILGAPVNFLVHPEDKERVRQYHVNRMLGKDVPERYEFKVLLKNGDTMWAETSITPIIWEGHPASINFVRSIGERKKAEALYKDKVRAEEASRAKTDFLAIMSHEMRTPLNTIIGAGDLLSETPLDEDQRKFLGMLQTAGDGLLQLINEVLDLSRIEAGKIEISAHAFDLRGLVESTCSLFSFQAGQKGLEFQVDIDPELPDSVLGDAARLRQIIINLVGNAVKFTHKGKVIVAVEVESPKGRDSLNLVLSVTDTGIGIPEKKLQTVFDSFTQVDSSITREYGGSGLGLTICRNLAELMGGTLTAVSNEGSGSTFSLALSLGIAGPDEDSATSDELKQCPLVRCSCDGSFRRVLLAEDTENNRLLIRAYLKQLPIRLDEAVNGEQAVQKILGNKYDLVLMDIQMPVMDGWEAVMEIRRCENNGRRTPIIALTANAMPEDIDRSRECGFDGHLSKPIRKSELINALAEALN